MYTWLLVVHIFWSAGGDGEISLTRHYTYQDCAAKAETALSFFVNKLEQRGEKIRLVTVECKAIHHDI